MDRKTQLQQVARDWCLTITASQVMPVYPLTEDLQPGDVFLVPMSVEEQRQRFDGRGFLPLDHHVARLTPNGYNEFYRDMFVVPAGASSVAFTRSLQRGTDGRSNWTGAPAVGFPSYGFSVSRSGGLNVGVPLSGIPVAMSLLNASQATGSVSIQKANTIGTDVVPLSDDLDRWAKKNAAYLMFYARNLDAAPAPRNGFSLKRTNDPGKAYLRMVSRIFVAGSVDIAIADSRAFAGGLDVGKPRPVDLLTPAAPNSLEDINVRRAENMRAAMAALNAQLAESEAPTRPSGSNANATPAQMDERAKAKLEKLEEARKARQAELDAAQKTLAAAEQAAAEDQAALDAARKTLAEKQAELAELESDLTATQAQRAAAQKALDDARKDVDAKGATEPLKALAKSQGEADVAKMALADVTSMIPGGSLRVTAASSRSVTMRQDFDMPLVIGYHAFDREILFSNAQGLHLGPPVATQRQILEKTLPVDTFDSNNERRAVQLRAAIRAFHENKPEKIKPLNELRLKLYPDPQRTTGFGRWAQTVPAAQLEMLMRAAEIPVPPVS